MHRGPRRLRTDRRTSPDAKSFHLPASEIEHYEGRLEFWDGRTETAWKVCEPTSIQHEGPSRRLVEMATRVASLRGLSNRVFRLGGPVASGHGGAQALADGRPMRCSTCTRNGRGCTARRSTSTRIRCRMSCWKWDHTTDVRRRKLGIYKECGFPEIWVLVPWEASVRAPGLAIHVRRDGGYREEAQSRAFQGWRAEEDPPRADGGSAVGGGMARAGTRGPGDGCSGRYGTGRRSRSCVR